MRALVRRSRWIAPLALPAVLLTALPGSASGAETGFYLAPGSQASDWVNSNTADPRAAGIKANIADVPRATWFAAYDPKTIRSQVKGVTDGAAKAGTTAAVVAYMIPNRDCGSHSAGGAPHYAAYEAWVQEFAQGLGSREVVVLLEPDAIAQGEDKEAATEDNACKSTGLSLAQRLAAIKKAGETIKRIAPAAKVYYDAGHSGWKVEAQNLKAAGVAQGDGIVTNVSNFRTTADEVAYGKELLAAIGVPSLGQIVDTSRNGNGPYASNDPQATWCNPPGRGLGARSTRNTGDPRVHAFLWVKAPGESDGGCRGFGGAGTFEPGLADELVRNSPNSPGTGTPPEPPKPDPGTQSCKAVYKPGSSWSGGHTAEIAVENNGKALSGWNLSWTFPGDQKITQSWNMTAAQSGRTVTATPVAHNTQIAAGQALTVGFVADGASGKPVDVKLNGSACSVS
ncbi:Endoglucanase E-2 precursor [Streptomyces sp. ADI96-02]|uniref:glycoside hydrolase family 6 protein n=1 Tax=Streptomyces sp. ADI96-02 TaxID=1522760 RepID=UPI000FAF7C39|nr:glycoside hydrolase family 6 protein [Streptomyces sp. ADI96-02]RPK69276.1 Endoglucanase E-2 precursor [Streptomyces sp. ADI96-02]